MAQLEAQSGESLDYLVGDWRIFQLQRGHRFSTDDLVTAWRASKAAPGALRYLDLGCGIGSVGMSTLHHLPAEAQLTGIEAQEVSVGLARRSVAYNGLEDRVDVVQGDLRDPEVLAPGRQFDLITGSPPYIPEGKGVLSPVPQRAAARMELRGSVFDYCRAARRWMAPGSRFCFVMASADPRTEAAPQASGLVVVERWEYVFRYGRTPHIATLVCAREEDVEQDTPRVEGELVIRGPDGAWTADYNRYRNEVGNVPPQGA
jgi:tRNA1(Val) A37 N6-methylase TrmN6